MRSAVCLLPLLVAHSCASFNASFNASSLQADMSAQLVELTRPFTLLCRGVLSWLVPLLVIVGVIGTSICLAGLLRRRATQPEVQPWFVALSLADMYVLLFCLPFFYLRLLIFIFPRYRSSLSVALALPDSPTASVLLCCAKDVLIYFGLLLSAWVQVGISLLRVLASQLPFNWRVHLTRRNSLLALGATVTACLLTTLGLILPVCHVQQHASMSLCAIRHGNRFFYASLCLRVLLPLLCLLTSSALIIRSLRQFSRHFAKHLPNGHHPGAGHRSPTPPQSSLLSSRPSNAALLISAQPEHSPARKRRLHHRISYILLGMNATFLLCTLPFEVLKLYDAYFRTHFIDNLINATDSNQSETTLAQQLQETLRWRLADRSLNALLYVNNATNWIFYFILGKQFRASIGRAMRQPSCLQRVYNRVRTRLHLLCPRCLRRRPVHRHRPQPNQPLHQPLHLFRSSHADPHRCVPIYLPMRRYSYRSAAQFHSH